MVPESMTERVYLDWNATAPLRPQARAAVLVALDAVGNPSSVHGEGRLARRLVEEARSQVAGLAGAEPADVIFTSGGSEANTMALTPAIAVGADMAPRGRLLVSAVEHLSVLAGGRFALGAVERIPVDAEGVANLAWLRRRLEELGRATRPLVSLMAANNETGVVQPVAQAAALVHDVGGLLHVDGVQIAGRLACDMAALGADLMTLSAHKLGGPKGVGALIVRDEAIRVAALVTGGGQERGDRAGTENVVGIVGFGAAAAAVREALVQEQGHTSALRGRLEDGIRTATPGAVIFGSKAERLPNTTLVALPGTKAETLVIAFDLEGIAVSSGAACSSGKVAPSHVLAAMGVAPALARAAIRVSLGPMTSESEIERFLDVWRKRAQSLSKEQRGLAA
jgi:cysteine desulfurase